MAEDRAVEIEQRHAHITRRTHRPYIRVVAIDIEEIVRDVDQATVIDHALARRAVNNHFPPVEPTVPEPKRQSPQSPRFWKVFRYPGAMSTERLGEIFHQRAKKLSAGFGRGSL